MKTMTVVAAGALVALTGMATSQTVRHEGSGVAAAVQSRAELAELRGLASLGALASLRDLVPLSGMSSLGDLASLRDLSSLASLARFADLGSLGAVSLGGEVDAPLRAMPRAAWAPADPADSLYRVARDAMGKGDYRRAAELFQQITERYPKSAYASESMYWRAFSLYRNGRSDDLTSALAVLKSLGERFPASAQRGDASTLRTRICGELAKRGDEQCAAEVTQLADPDPRPAPSARSRSDAQCPTGDEDDDRVAALNALLQMDSERAIPILEKVLARRDACSAPLRRKAVFLLSLKRGADVADALVKVAQSDPDSEVRQQAVFWLGQTGSERAVDLLAQILATSKDEELKDKAIFALSQHSSARAEQMLRDAAARESEPEDIREKAIFWLGQRRGSENAGFLRELYARLKNENLKDKILFSLSQQRGAGNEKWLMDLARNAGESIEMRKKALFWAAQSGVSIGELTDLYARMDDRDMREQLIFVYSQRRDPQAVDKLMSIAKTEKDPELRKKAIFWLSQSRDPRVAKFLEDLIGS
jgi:TolA-binding protein